jgi:hypothetical protein
VAPYVLVAGGLAEYTTTLLIGRGPGIVSRDVEANRFNTGRVEANYPLVPKLAAEYGVIARLIFCWFILVSVISGTPSATMSAIVLALYFVLSGNLLQPRTVLIAHILTSLYSARPGAADDSRPPAGRPYRTSLTTT